jgi:hypothetical protein
MSAEFLTDDRVKGVRRLLLITLTWAAVVVLLALPLLFGAFESENRRYGVVLLVVAAVLGAAGGLSLRAVTTRAESARRLCILTGILTVILSVPLVSVWIGLLTAITGIGLLVVVVAPEREPR